ncbi:probable glutamate receptor [Amphibalanus amphitrite]|uniref:probable glutamate receptor n=1 Tax=Amphibalanus amphitrite TaxID=1232801 RepID=UPI001C8FE448|nr:probable glutamate receptor [Amphibalanus amphitrite]
MARLLSINWTAPDSEDASAVLRVTGIHNPPFFIVGSDGVSISGYLCDIWRLISDRLGLRYQLSSFNSSDYGTRLENGSWTGLIGQAANNRADVLLSWFMHAPGRGEVLDFLDAAPVEQTEYAFYLAEDSKAVSVEWASFASLLKPLHTASWVVLLFTLLVTAALLWFTIHYNHSSAESRTTVRQFGLADCQLATFMALTGQGWSVAPDSLAARTV